MQNWGKLVVTYSNWICVVLVLIGTDVFSYIIVSFFKSVRSDQRGTQIQINSLMLLLSLMMVNIFVHKKGSNYKRLQCKTYSWLFSRHMFVCPWGTAWGSWGRRESEIFWNMVRLFLQHAVNLERKIFVNGHISAQFSLSIDFLETAALKLRNLLSDWMILCRACNLWSFNR